MADVNGKKRRAIADGVGAPSAKRIKREHSIGSKEDDAATLRAQNEAEKKLWPRPPLAKPIDSRRDSIGKFSLISFKYTSPCTCNTFCTSCFSHIHLLNLSPF